MERTLVLIRHAKSDWGIPAQPDFERPLNARGKRDAPEMGKRLKEKDIIPDLIISSPAARAAATAKLIAAETGYDEQKIQWQEKLYHCFAETFEDVIVTSGIPDTVKTVFIFAHNPGITQFTQETIPTLRIADMPTCGMVALSFDALHWSDYSSVIHTFSFFDYPKNQ